MGYFPHSQDDFQEFHSDHYGRGGRVADRFGSQVLRYVKLPAWVCSRGIVGDHSSETDGRDGSESWRISESETEKSVECFLFCFCLLKMAGFFTLRFRGYLSTNSFESICFVSVPISYLNSGYLIRVTRNNAGKI